MRYEEFKNKKNWAVVGSVHNKEKYAYRIFNFLKSKGYEVYAVDPSGNDVDGVKSYLTLSDVPVKLDAVNMVINPVRGITYIEEAKTLEIGHIWFQPGAESDEGVSKAKELGMEIVHGACVMMEF